MLVLVLDILGRVFPDRLDSVDLDDLNVLGRIRIDMAIDTSTSSSSSSATGSGGSTSSANSAKAAICAW